MRKHKRHLSYGIYTCTYVIQVCVGYRECTHVRTMYMCTAHECSTCTTPISSASHTPLPQGALTTEIERRERRARRERPGHGGRSGVSDLVPCHIVAQTSGPRVREQQHAYARARPRQRVYAHEHINY